MSIYTLVSLLLLLFSVLSRLYLLRSMGVWSYHGGVFFYDRCRLID